MDAVFKALADPTRRTLLDRLHAKNGQTLSELCRDLEMTRQAVTQHLALLEEANLVASVWHGREKLHYLNPAPLQEIHERWLDKYESRRLEALSGLKKALENQDFRSNRMSKPEFVYVAYIATTPEKLWAALTQGEFTKKYWYGRRIESDWQVGSPVRFFDGDSDDLTDSGVVLEYDPPKRLAYTFQNEFDPSARKLAPSRVTFSLQPQEGMVKLTLVHDELPSEEMAEGFREGWSPILSSLKTFLESGKPLPQLRSLEEKGRPQKVAGKTKA